MPARQTPLLALDERDRKLAGHLLAEFLDDHERNLPDVARIVPDVDRDVLTGLLQEPFPEQGIGVERLFRKVSDEILPNSTAVAHPRFLAYVQGPPNGIAPYAEAIAAAINQNCNFWQLSPAASVIERSVISWLAGLFRYPGTAGGILTSGGSIATLNALTTALHDRRPDFRRTGLQDARPPLVLYTSKEAHRCVEKAAAILGLGLDNVRQIPTDADYRMRVDALKAAIQADRAAGLEPFCVVATTGTVTSGSIDPVEAIADVCRDERLWLHIDGAYGALFVLSDRKREAFSACARADSIALDPHKLLFAPLEAGCLIVRDSEKLRAAFAVHSSYLTVNDDPLMLDFMNYGPQLSRSFKALKVWAALQTFGTETFRKAIDHTLALAQYLAERIQAEPHLRLIAPVPLTAVCFRINNASDADHTALLATLASEGTALLGPASLNGRKGIRACITNYRTTREDIDLIVNRLAHHARTAEPSLPG
ncbi:pyridoxal phosphate-dependent decarboxylase family protein [Actinomadura rupiterrae]|uniref:pyridoxal phosphate-dependent decarboxylase family protein n=1 Tax=Actinomadura rupiterrae TaxID=559627 RepID=UPI0020A5E683|nr:aminotransferase class V-fold PLP-dependent enzyme [Actinomadura rupiterrae]MCP2341677.1 aromatic-L-amino-acid decarboxylase [Actinomadura rupiterrae]